MSVVEEGSGARPGPGLVGAAPSAPVMTLYTVEKFWASLLQGLVGGCAVSHWPTVHKMDDFRGALQEHDVIISGYERALFIVYVQ